MKCTHERVEITASLSSDGHRDYESKCLDCEAELDVVLWLAERVKILSDRISS